MKISRRKFIACGLMTPLLGSSPYSFAQNTQKNEIFLGGGKFLDPKTNSTQHVFTVLDLVSGGKNIINTDFLPHGISLKPDAPGTLAVFEKKGSHACEIDLLTQEKTRVIRTDPKRYFYGHGAYSLDSQLLYCTETYLDGYKGIIAVRDAKTYQYLGEFPSYGKEPHECVLIDNGNTLVVTNGGGAMNGTAPSVTYIDIKSEKLLEQVELTNSRINTGHLAIGQDKSLVVVSAPRAGLSASELGGVSIRSDGEILSSIIEPTEVTSRMKGEALSVVIHEAKKIAAVTHPSGNMVTFWSMSDNKLLNSIEFEKPRGVAITSAQDAFVISYGKGAKVVEVDVNTLKVIDKSRRHSTYITGSHLYNWSLELKRIREMQNNA